MSVLEGRMTEQIMQNEEMLLMACVDEKKAEKDSGWSNHMCRKKELSYHIDENFRQTVKLGDNSSMVVMSKGNVKFKINEIRQVITEVFMYQTWRTTCWASDSYNIKVLRFLYKKEDVGFIILTKGGL